MENKKGLKYIGSGASLLGVPARDLTPEEVEEFGGVVCAGGALPPAQALIESGLYKAESGFVKFTTTAKPGGPSKEGE